MANAGHVLEQGHSQTFTQGNLYARSGGRRLKPQGTEYLGPYIEAGEWLCGRNSEIPPRQLRDLLERRMLRKRSSAGSPDRAKGFKLLSAFRLTSPGTMKMLALFLYKSINIMLRKHHVTCVFE